MVEKENTPFGNFVVEVNEKKISFESNYKTIKYENKNYDIKHIEIDLSDLKIGDEIICKLEGNDLCYNDSDERCNLLTIENNKIIMGINGYEPQYHEIERLNHCFELYDCNQYFKYTIERNPTDYKNSFKDAYTITLDICWIKKSQFQDYNTAIFMILI